MVGYHSGTSFHIFPGGSKILTDFLGRGVAKYEKNKIVCAKTQKSLFFKIRGGGQMLPPYPPNDVPAIIALILDTYDFNQFVERFALFVRCVQNVTFQVQCSYAILN